MRKILLCLLAILSNELLGQSNTVDHTKVGTVAPSAKYLDVDHVYPFNRGAAIIVKGNSHAIIDQNFHQIVPFNKYEYIASHGRSGLFSGSAKFKPTDLLNSQGKVIHSFRGDPPRIENWPDGFAWFGEARRELTIIPVAITCINAKGRKITFKTTNALTFDEWHEGLVRFNTENGYGYMDTSGKIVIPAQYVSAKEFSEGLAAVSKKNEFGEIKWGFIDKTGKVKIPFQYSMPPSSFGFGLAAIVPRVQTDIKFSLINQNGEVRVNVPLSSKAEVNTDKKFVGGFMRASLLGGCDILGEEYSYQTMFAQAGLPGRNMKYPDWYVEEPYQDGQIVFARRTRERAIKKGILDIANERYIDPIFEEISLFDPISNLAYAKLETGKDNNGFPIYREGYINRQGIFVLVKQAKNNW
ncbi:MAG TPA: WG repeat-containing protein [Chitinophagaceae bacterium]|nr:WG repeat-containing protein [Chitinophagaceae bacterium]